MECNSNSRQKLKFNIDLDPQKTFGDQIIIRVDTGADINCINENTFNALFPEVKLKHCPHIVKNFGNSAADIQVLGEFQAFSLFKGVKYLNIFVVTNANDCPNRWAISQPSGWVYLKPATH